MSKKEQSEEDVEKSRNMTEDVIGILREENEKLRKQLESSASKELVEAVLVAAHFELRTISDSVGNLMRESAKACDSITALLSKLEVAKVGEASSSVCKFPTWKTIRLGTHKDATALHEAIDAKKNRISDWGKDILKRIKVSPTEQEIDLVHPTVADLGLPKGGTRKQIYAKAKELGLALCPAEVGPQLRLQYQDQPSGEWILIGMEPITDSNGNPNVFDVEHSGVGRWLRAGDGHADHFWNPEDRWVFARSK